MNGLILTPRRVRRPFATRGPVAPEAVCPHCGRAPVSAVAAVPVVEAAPEPVAAAPAVLPAATVESQPETKIENDLSKKRKAGKSVG